MIDPFLENPNPDNASQAHEKDFTNMLVDAGVPITHDSIKDKFQAEMANAELAIKNDAEISPFWRIIKELITLPVLWLVQLMIKHVLPQGYLKTASGAYLELIAWGYDIERKQKSKAQGYIDFNRVNTSGDVLIKADTVINSKSIKGVVYQVKTLADALLVDGVATLPVLCEAVVAGDASNLGENYYIVPYETIDGIDSVSNVSDWLTLPGQDKETDDDLRLRCRNKFAAVGNWHVNSMYKAIITRYANIGINQVFIVNDAPRGPGTANAYILLSTGEPAQTFLDAIQHHIMVDGHHGLGDDVQVLAMPANHIDLNVGLHFYDTITDADKETVLTQVPNFIRAAFRENETYTPTVTEPYKTFSFSRLGRELHDHFKPLEDVNFNLTKIEHNLFVSRLNSLTVSEND